MPKARLSPTVQVLDFGLRKPDLRHFFNGMNLKFQTKIAVYFLDSKDMPRSLKGQMICMDDSIHSSKKM
jgi:hypothetical protein